ncbi:MAG: 2,4-dihydroxyhept-2-ene-1,7-dioic acid aldolase [Candidatus Latescibacteria bacterium]|nr:2,4-dihydroxyhept-2-ene-1,7-dioic acid aldolase [Candidatus Latescibacterota bacterium]
MKNPIRETLAAGRPSVGAWLNLASPLAAEVMAAAGFPWLVVDTEHSAFDLDLIAHTFRAIEARGAVPLARAWDHDPVTMARLLDAGAWGIVVPHVSTPEQARKLAQAMRYPPRGTRSVGTGRCVTLSPDYRKVFDDVVLCIPQIEDLEGIANAEAIARVEGVDIGFLGPADLAMSMGVEPGHPDHEAALQRFREGCQRAGKPAGIPIRKGAEEVRQRLAEGFRFLDSGSDLRLLDTGARKLLAEIHA